MLRIDDNDAIRSRPEFVDDIFYTLDWLEIECDMGPESPEDFVANFSQRHRMDLHESFLKELMKVPQLMYSCSCSRKEIQEQSQSGLYPGTCRDKEIKWSQKNVAWRVKVPEELEVSYKEWSSGSRQSIFPGQQMGDFVVRRKDGLPSYQLVSLVDDIYYGVNFIVRGSDLCDSTAAQIFLARSVSPEKGSWISGAKAFLENEFFHHTLLLDSAGHKLSKSKGAASVHLMRKWGKRPVEVYRMVAEYCGLPEESAISLNSLLEAFQPALLLKK